MKASAKLKFMYYLYDSYGNKIYSKNFVIMKDHIRDYQIKPKKGIPSGILVHRFEFEDGSFISITNNKF